MATKLLVGGKGIQPGYAGRKRGMNASCPGEEGNEMKFKWSRMWAKHQKQDRGRILRCQYGGIVVLRLGWKQV